MYTSITACLMAPKSPPPTASSKSVSPENTASPFTTKQTMSSEWPGVGIASTPNDRQGEVLEAARSRRGPGRDARLLVRAAAPAAPERQARRRGRRHGQEAAPAPDRPARAERREARDPGPPGAGRGTRGSR